MKKLLGIVVLGCMYFTNLNAYELENCYLTEVQGEDKYTSFLKKQITKKFDNNSYEALYFDITENGVQKVFVYTEEEIQRQKKEFKPLYKGHEWKRNKILKSNWKITFVGDKYVEAKSAGVLDRKMEINLKNGLVIQSDDLILTKYKCDLNLKRQSSYLDYWWALILIIAITFFIYTQSASRLKKIKIRRK